MIWWYYFVFIFREHAEKAIIIMEKLLPPEHLMLASVKRVKALILEEIALDTMINNSGIVILFRSLFH